VRTVSDTEQAFTSFEPGAAVAAGSIPLCVPELRGNEWRYVKECLDTGWVSSVGQFVEQLEERVASYVGAAHGVATSSGTAALHLALLVAGVKPDDEVLVSDLTFIAPANAIRYVNAWPVLIDADQAEKTAEQTGNHMAGWRGFQPLYDWLLTVQPDFLDE